MRALEGHVGWVRSVAFSPDGAMLVSGSYDHSVRLWDVATGEPRQRLTGHTNAVLAVAFAPDGQWIASGGRDQTVRLWQAQTGQLLRTLLGHTDWVRGLAFHPHGSTLASGAYDQKLCFWSIATGQLEQTTQGYSNPVMSIDYSPDGNTLVNSGAADIHLWHGATGRLQQTLRGHTNRIRAVAFGPPRADGGQLLASGGYDKTIRLWTLPATAPGAPVDNSAMTGAPGHVLTGQRDTIRTLAFSPNGQQLASGSDDGTVYLWDLATGFGQSPAGTVLPRGQQERAAPISAVAFASGTPADTLVLAGAGTDQSIYLWAVASAQTMPGTDISRGSTVTHATVAHTTVAHERTGRVLAVLHEPAAGNRVIAFRPYREGVMPLLASGGYDGTIRLWDLTPLFNTKPMPALILDQTGHSGAESGELTDKIQVWRTLKVGNGRVRCLAFSPDGKTLVSGGTDRNLYLWDMASGEVRQTLVGHTDWVLSVVFQPLADLAKPILASSSADETLRLWDLQRGACLQTMRPPGPYTGVNITGVTGITDAQRSALKALGAVEG